MPARYPSDPAASRIARRSLILSSGLATLLTACSPQPEPEPTESLTQELLTRISGATITSPNAKRSATYLSVRRIDTLDQVGALPGALGTLAQRVDGVIGAKPADGRFSVTEILRMEEPAYIRTLFPAERAALPALWALLETTPDSPTPVVVAALPAFSPVDSSTGATVPLKPPKLDIASLPTDLKAAAERLEYVTDSDGDLTTVTEVDLDDPLNTPDPWTPAEIDAFKRIKQLFIARAGTTLKSEVTVPEPNMTSGPVATWGPATLQLIHGIEYNETRSATFFRSTDAGLYVDLSAHRISQATLNLGAGQQLVILDETSESELVAGAGSLTWPHSGNATIEVWSGGSRLNSYRVVLPKITPVDERIDMKPYIDYTLRAGGKALIKNVVSASVRYDTYSTSNNAAYTFDLATKPLPTGVSTAALSLLATPRSSLPPGRYEVNVPRLGIGTCKLEISPEGVVTFTRPGGAPVRAGMYIWTYTKFDAQYSDRLRGLFDPRTNGLNIFFDGGASLSNSVITGDHRSS